MMNITQMCLLTAVRRVAGLAAAVGLFIPPHAGLAQMGGEPAAPDAGLVHLDVIVTGAHDAPVLDLRPDEFTLDEDGVSQEIRTAALEHRSASGSESRLYGVFLDEYHTSPGEPAARARRGLARFVDEILGPDDRVVVMKPLDPLSTIAITDDREAVRRAIATFAGLKGDYTARTSLERELMGTEPGRVERSRAQVVLSGLRALAARLGELGSGRKSIVLVSEGFVRPAERGGERLPDVASVVRVANRWEVAIYPVAPAPGSDAAWATLQRLAEGTSGEAILSDDDFSSGLRRVAHEQAAVYRLTYQSSHPPDGRFHGIRVRVNRPGATVRARPGYWASGPADRTTGPAPGLALTRFRPQKRSPLIEPWFGMTRAPDGRTRVTFAWIPGTRAASARTTRAVAAVELRAVAEDGASIFQGRVLPARARGGDLAAERAVFDVPPGLLAIDIAIQGADRHVLDVDLRNLVVPDLRGTRIVIAPLLLLRSRTALEFRALSLDSAALPTTAREFSRTERLLLRVPAYGPGEATPPVTARLLNRAGRVMRDLPVVPGALPEGVTQFDLPLSALAPGEYAVEVTAAGSAGHQTKEVIAIRVTG